jgi:hypothetical protein
MSSSLQVKYLIKRYGFYEITNDIKWLKKTDTEVKEIYKKEKCYRKRNNIKEKETK